jgi:FkbM family methyltransferase
MKIDKTIAGHPKNSGRLEFSNACLLLVTKGVSRIPVLKRLYPSLQKAWAFLTWTGGYQIKRYRGILFLLNYRNFVDRKIGLGGSYGGAVCINFLADMEKGCDLFIDAGASLGIYALQAAHRGLAGEIHAFDPDPRNYAQLMGNLYLNRFTDIIQAHQVALSDMSGTLQFEAAPEGKTNMTQVATPVSGVPGALGHLVRGTGKICGLTARTLDEMFPYQGKKIFIKMHIQGHELEALKGAACLLRNNACFLQVSIWPEDQERVIQHLAAAGYRVVRSSDTYYCFTR